MVKLILGKKGSGKTKKMIDLANDSVETKGGSIVYINKDNRVIYDLKHDIRLISMNEYEELNNSDEYIGFLYGIISSDHDIEVIFIDSILRHTHIDVKDLPKFLERIRVISKIYNIEFVVSISAEPYELEQLTTEYEILN
jgi:DNA-dependent RNA polymerase auxiliary subunit epsilon